MQACDGPFSSNLSGLYISSMWLAYFECVAVRETCDNSKRIYFNIYRFSDVIWIFPLFIFALGSERSFQRNWSKMVNTSRIAFRTFCRSYWKTTHVPTCNVEGVHYILWNSLFYSQKKGKKWRSLNDFKKMLRFLY